MPKLAIRTRTQLQPLEYGHPHSFIQLRITANGPLIPHNFFSLPENANTEPKVLSALALTEVTSSSTRAANFLKVHHRIIPEDLTLCHDIKMITVSILISSSNSRTPLCIAIIRTQIRNHDNDALACYAPGTARRAGRRAR